MQEVIAKFLTDNVKITKLADHSAANTTAITSAELDMAGFEGVVFVSSFGTAAANNVFTLHQSVAPAGEAASVALIASGTSDEDVILDVQWNPAYRYAKVVATRGTSSTIESMWAIQYGARSKSQSSALSGTAAVGQFSSPALA